MENLNIIDKKNWNRHCLYSVGFLVLGILAVIIFIKISDNFGIVSNWIFKAIFNTDFPFTPQQLWWRNLIESAEFLIEFGVISALFIGSVWSGIVGVKKVKINSERGRILGVIVVTLVASIFLTPVLARILEILF